MSSRFSFQILYGHPEKRFILPFSTPIRLNKYVQPIQLQKGSDVSLSPYSHLSSMPLYRMHTHCIELFRIDPNHENFLRIQAEPCRNARRAISCYGKNPNSQSRQCWFYYTNEEEDDVTARIRNDMLKQRQHSRS